MKKNTKAGSSEKKAATGTKLKEAEVCWSMGLLEESLAIYREILDSDIGLGEEEVRSIENKVRMIEEEIDGLEMPAAKKEQSADYVYLKKKIALNPDIPTILQGAKALREMGLVEEAAKEYEKLFEFDRSESDYSPGQVLGDYASCLLNTKPSAEVEFFLKKASEKIKPSRKDLANARFQMGGVLEGKGELDRAASMYRAAADLDPEDKKAKSKVEEIDARFSNATRFDYLLKKKLVTTEQLKSASKLSRKSNKSIEFVLVDHFKIDKAELGKSLSAYHRCPFVGFDPEMHVPYELIGKMKKSFLLYYLWVPLRWSKQGVDILIDDPGDLRKTDNIKALMSRAKVNYSVGIREDIVKFIEHFFGSAKKKPDKNMMRDLDSLIPEITFDEVEEEEDDLPDLLDESSGQVVRFVDQVLVTAYRDNASDIHFEPSPVSSRTSIRFRIDGVCHQYMEIPNAMINGIISRLKIMAGLDIAERRLPQDGKIKMRRKGIPQFELRISTMPTAGGFEDAVLRILAQAGAMALGDMGLLERNYEKFESIINKPYGIVLVVGPTGSGKTTTLHSALGYLNRPDIKIWTAEDPVEITQQGLRQVEARPKIGLDFSRIMRGFLRLDPDVIMIGEMRDKETTSIGVEASLTGHLVFSTLHTISAPETITRLIDMGINALNFSDAFLGVLAQRLVRRLCKNCKQAYHPTRDDFQDIVNEYGPSAFEKTGIRYDDDLTLYRAAGCDACSGSGYKGRMGIHELMEGTPEIKTKIKNKASTEELFEQAFKDGMTTLKQDGIMKVFMGHTDFLEVRRVVSK